MDTCTLRRRIRADRARWAQARSLADVGELTALWLEGGIIHQPGYGDPDPGEVPGPAPETRDLVPVLAACNRAGFVTTGSQPGVPDDGSGSGQRAAVEGFCDAATRWRIRSAVVLTGLILIEHDPRSLPRRRCDYSQAVTVTRDEGRDFTWFGAQVPRRHITGWHTGYGECHKDVVGALTGAWQITIIDPVWGRNDVLWPALEAFAQQGA